MLREISPIAQNDLPYYKRWFHDNDTNLFIWEIEGVVKMIHFTFVYSDYEYMYMWEKGKTSKIHQVSSGGHDRTPIGINASQIISSQIICNKELIKEYFLKLSPYLPEHIKNALFDNLY